MKMLRKYIW